MLVDFAIAVAYSISSIQVLRFAVTSNIVIDLWLVVRREVTSFFIF